MIAAPLLLGIPSKGRLQDNCRAFFEEAGIRFLQERGGRAYRGRVAGVPEVEILFLSASEIAGELASGGLHLGVTGEDLVRETVSDAHAKLRLLTPLGFGEANVVVAVPKSWVDVRSMADLDDVAAAFRHRHGRRLKVATKYTHLTRQFFSQHGLIDYLIVESLGATEGAPASGAADLIVDITTTGATLAANGLRALDDGVILRSEAHLVVSLLAPWDAQARQSAGLLLARIVARARASLIKEVRCLAPDAAVAAKGARLFGAIPPFGLPLGGHDLTLHAPASEIYPLAEWLAGEGAQAITIRSVDFIFSPDNPLLAMLERGLAGC